ncbi:hypothetical protein GCM10023100_49880 [Actinocorallia cavernae]|uniref:Transposase n=2 Tax=Actinomycetes TaxID=1760 RepID=A0ABP5YKF8_9ACTN
MRSPASLRMQVWADVPTDAKAPLPLGVSKGQGRLRHVFYSTVTDFARFLGLSMSRPRAFAVW